ncbi:MAG TPA: hypothetical protein VNR70_08780 [Steroidobacteraceae bacterium]|nr:hypothetical protein [Steroidobacteraceae bacterium]
MAGIALFSFVLCSVLAGQLGILKVADARGMGDAARRFSAVALCAWPVMAGFFAMAIANVRRPQTHKRWMVVLMSAMMTPAGKPHPVYMYGGLILLAQQMLTVPFAATATWMNIATAFERLAG